MLLFVRAAAAPLIVTRLQRRAVGYAIAPTQIVRALPRRWETRHRERAPDESVQTGWCWIHACICAQRRIHCATDHGHQRG